MLFLATHPSVFNPTVYFPQFILGLKTAMDIVDQRTSLLLLPVLFLLFVLYYPTPDIISHRQPLRGARLAQ